MLYIICINYTPSGAKQVQSATVYTVIIIILLYKFIRAHVSPKDSKKT